MDWGTWAAFLGASVLLTLMPGPDILFVITRSLTGGRRDGSAIGLGLCTGLLVHISAAALGVSAVVYRSEAAFQAVKILGAAYLFYLGWKAWLSSRLKPDTPPSDGASGPGMAERIPFGKLYRRGIFMNVTNPKVSLFFVAFLPQFVVKGAGPVYAQMALLGLSFLAQALVLFQTVALLAGRLGGSWVRRPGASAWAGRLEAVVYAVLGAQLLMFHLF